MRRGYTLLELMAVLALFALVGASLAPAARRYRDRVAVLGARESVAGLIAEARVAALARGGAVVHVASEPWRAWSEGGQDTLRLTPLEEEWGVSVGLARGRHETRLVYDGLGLGRVASETLRFRRGEAEVGLVVSGYGRVRRW